MNIIMICVRTQTTIDYCGIAHLGNNSKSGPPISLPVHYFFCLFNNRVKSLQDLLKISSISLVNRIFHLFIY